VLQPERGLYQLSEDGRETESKRLLLYHQQTQSAVLVDIESRDLQYKQLFPTSMTVAPHFGKQFANTLNYRPYELNNCILKFAM